MKRSDNRSNIEASDGYLNRIIKESVRSVIREFDNKNEYYEHFYTKVQEAEEALYRALSFCGQEMSSDILVKRIRKAYDIINEVVYFIRQRERG